MKSTPKSNPECPHCPHCKTNRFVLGPPEFIGRGESEEMTCDVLSNNDDGKRGCGVIWNKSTLEVTMIQDAGLTKETQDWALSHNRGLK